MQETFHDKSGVLKGGSRRWVRWRWGTIAGVVLLGMGGVTVYHWNRGMVGERREQVAVTAPVMRTVTALGRLEPEGEVIRLSAPSSNQGNRVERLLVQEGDRVEAGEVIAVLDTYGQRQAAVAEAAEAVRVARAQLEVVRAGAKQGEIRAQQAEIDRLRVARQGDVAAQAATVARLEAEWRNAETEFGRYELLYQQGAIAAAERDQRRLTLDTAEKAVQEAQVTLERIRNTTPEELNQARATLERIAEVRPVDVRSAEAEVSRAEAARQQAQASFEQAVVRSPLAGEVLEVQTRSGEVVGTEGIVEIGQTQRMQAIAEVYQSDVGRVRLGQRVRVTSDSIAGELMGRVERIGSQVKRQTIVNTDPSTNIDARVIEVRVILDDGSSRRAAKLTNLQVQVVIEQ